jgi:ElaB/YqjD/DUF883 family membrane-anchored ribosome-binding protein
MDGESTNKDRLVSDLKALVSDAEELLRATASQAGEKITDARQKIEQSLVEGKKAIADAEKTIVKKSKECAEIADDYVLIDQVPSAIPFYLQTLELNKDNADVRYKLAQSFLKTGQRDQAIRNLEEMLKANPFKFEILETIQTLF